MRGTDPQHESRDHRADTKRHDERVDAEDHDEEPVDDTDQRAERQGDEDRQTDGHAVLRVQDSDEHARHRQGGRHGEVVVARRQRDQQRERQDDEGRLGTEHRREVLHLEVRLRRQDAEDHDDDDPGDDQGVALGVVAELEAPLLVLRLVHHGWQRLVGRTGVGSIHAGILISVPVPSTRALA